MKVGTNITAIDLKVYIIYIIRLNNHETNIAQKRPNQDNSQKNVLLYPGCREKKGRTACPTPKQTLFL